LERRVALDTCKGERGCEQKVKRPALPSKATLDKTLGPQMANLLRNGVLPVGGVELEFRYRAGRLAPQISVEPAFLLVHMPQLDSVSQPTRLVELAESRPAVPNAAADSNAPDTKAPATAPATAPLAPPTATTSSAPPSAPPTTSTPTPASPAP